MLADKQKKRSKSECRNPATQQRTSSSLKDAESYQRSNRFESMLSIPEALHFQRFQKSNHLGRKFSKTEAHRDRGQDTTSIKHLEFARSHPETISNHANYSKRRKPRIFSPSHNGDHLVSSTKSEGKKKSQDESTAQTRKTSETREGQARGTVTAYYHLGTRKKGKAQ